MRTPLDVSRHPPSGRLAARYAMFALLAMAAMMMTLVSYADGALAAPWLILAAVPMIAATAAVLAMLDVIGELKAVPPYVMARARAEQAIGERLDARGGVSLSYNGVTYDCARTPDGLKVGAIKHSELSDLVRAYDQNVHVPFEVYHFRPGFDAVGCTSHLLQILVDAADGSELPPIRTRMIDYADLLADHPELGLATVADLNRIMAAMRYGVEIPE